MDPVEDLIAKIRWPSYREMPTEGAEPSAFTVPDGVGIMAEPPSEPARETKNPNEADKAKKKHESRLDDYTGPPIDYSSL